MVASSSNTYDSGIRKLHLSLSLSREGEEGRAFLRDFLRVRVTMQGGITFDFLSPLHVRLGLGICENSLLLCVIFFC